MPDISVQKENYCGFDHAIDRSADGVASRFKDFPLIQHVLQHFLNLRSNGMIVPSSIIE